MTAETEVLVVGAGIMGAATARSLARRGREVTVLERFGVGHDRGSSHGDSRVFRLSYEDPAFVAMARDSLALWRELEREAGQEILRTTGGLDVGGPRDRHVEALEAHGIPHEIVDGAEAMRRFPSVSVPRTPPLLLQEDAGFLFAHRAWRAFASGARAAGARILEEEPVTGLSVEDDGVIARTERETYRAGVAVVTAGAWSRDLLAGLGIDPPVTVTRETPVYFAVEPEVELPIVVEWSTPPVYALPSPAHGLKAARHHAGPVVDPEEEGRPEEGAVAPVAAWVAERWPVADPAPRRADTCLYTSTEDERFVLERHGPIVVGSACSGHGFKFAPWVGERLADLASG